MNRVILVVRAEAYQYPCKAFRGTAEAQYVFNNHVKHTIVLQKYTHLDKEKTDVHSCMTTMQSRGADFIFNPR
jgi:hypothetical protein